MLHTTRLLRTAALGLIMAHTGCPKATPPAAVAAPMQAARSADPVELDAFFDKVWEERLANDPTFRTYLGVGDDHSQWGDQSDAGFDARVDRAEAHLAEMRERFDPEGLPAESALSYRLFEHEVAQLVAGRRWRLHDYPVNQMRGQHTWFANLLMGVQPLSSPEHIDDWVARLRGVPQLTEVLIGRLEAREAAGVMPPAFAYPKALDAGNNLLRGAPFDAEADSPLYRAFRDKVAKMGLPEEDVTAAEQQVAQILTEDFAPAYQRLLDFLEGQGERATDDDGAWKLPDGEAYYQHQLRSITTTSMTAEEIHTVGLAEVERIHREMGTIQEQLAVEGSLRDFFAHVQDHPDLTLPDTDEGREKYLALAEGYLKGIDRRLDEVFLTRPAASLEVKAVEKWREKSSGKAFYQRGTVDGTRPGRFYANLSDMSQVPAYQLQALVYHEGVPGHHMQLSIAQELKGIPAFRRHLHVTAWSEGWGLYSEWLPVELGLYSDPYSDFGRLAMELWRAARLVVDTGIHHKKWTRQQAIDWLTENTPNSEADAVKSVERYIVWPGQATAYKVGMLELQRLRTHAEEQLGERFVLAEFHDVVLQRGPLPLGVLAEQVDVWIATVPED